MFNERDRRCAAIPIMLSDHMKLSNADISGLLSMPVRTIRSFRKQLEELSDPMDVVDRKKRRRRREPGLSGTSPSSTRLGTSLTRTPSVPREP
uniref:Uncharacterized protein n=1 Tax=Lepeophtheirus salmonis TaxID=72036 RepID=A0A0K2TX34_LEPSM